jgi:hypothetical protein
MQKVGRKVRLEGKHAPPRFRGETGTLVQIEHHLQFPYSVRLDENPEPPTHPSHDQIVQVKEKALNYADEDSGFEDDKYDDFHWDKHMELYLSEDEKQSLLDNQ